MEVETTSFFSFIEMKSFLSEKCLVTRKIQFLVVGLI